MSAVLIALGAVASLLVYRDPPDAPLPPVVPGSRGTLASVLTSRDLWLLSLATAVFAAMQTVWMSFLVLYLQTAVGLSLIAASRLLALAQFGGMTGRVLFGVLSTALRGRPGCRACSPESAPRVHDRDRLEGAAAPRRLA